MKIPNLEGFSRIVRSMTDPARRHLCPVCKKVYECHLCSINEVHPVHSHGDQFWFPTVCDTCAPSQGLLTVFTHNREQPRGLWREYDYLTGDLISTYPTSGVIFGHGFGGRMRSTPIPLNKTITRKRPRI